MESEVVWKDQIAVTDAKIDTSSQFLVAGYLF